MTEHNPPLAFLAAVSKTEAAREALIAFRNQHMKLIEQHDKLIAAYNDSLDEAKDLYKRNADEIGPKYGEYSITYKTEVDAKKLLELMPNAEAAVKIEYAIDRPEYKKLVSAGLIPKSVVEQIETRGTPSVFGPKKV